jgi:hypothetical protein
MNGADSAPKRRLKVRLTPRELGRFTRLDRGQGGVP